MTTEHALISELLTAYGVSAGVGYLWKGYWYLTDETFRKRFPFKENLGYFILPSGIDITLGDLLDTFLRDHRLKFKPRLYNSNKK